MYLGLIALALGIAVWVGGPWPAPIAVFVTTNFVHVPYEEAQMRREFGAVCDNYVVHVRRGL